jgi:hypothetical protein
MPTDIAKLMGHANISTSERYVRNLPVGAGEAVMLKNQRRHSSSGKSASASMKERRASGYEGSKQHQP